MPFEHELDFFDQGRLRAIGYGAALRRRLISTAKFMDMALLISASVTPIGQHSKPSDVQLVHTLAGFVLQQMACRPGYNNDIERCRVIDTGPGGSRRAVFLLEVTSSM